MWLDPKFLARFFTYFSAPERALLARVCATWKEVLYSTPAFWLDLRPVLPFKILRNWQEAGKKNQFYLSLKQRGFDTLVLMHANDGDIFDFIQVKES